VVTPAVYAFWLLFTFVVVVGVSGFRAVFACRIFLLAARLGVIEANAFFGLHRAWYVWACKYYFIANKHLFREIG